MLTEIAPHLVAPMGFLFPVYKRSRRSVFTVNLGMWVYDGLSLFRSPRIHQNLGAKAVAEVEPMLGQDGLKGAPLYWDCSTDDARLTLESALDAVSQGAVVLTWTKVTGLLHNDQGRVSGVKVRDQLSGEEREISANAVINATGPWSDKTRQLSAPAAADRLRPTKGVHIVVNARPPTRNHPAAGQAPLHLPPPPHFANERAQPMHLSHTTFQTTVSQHPRRNQLLATPGPLVPTST